MLRWKIYEKGSTWIYDHDLTMKQTHDYSDVVEDVMN